MAGGRGALPLTICPSPHMKCRHAPHLPPCYSLQSAPATCMPPNCPPASSACPTINLSPVLPANSCLCPKTWPLHGNWTDGHLLIYYLLPLLPAQQLPLLPLCSSSCCSWGSNSFSPGPGWGWRQHTLHAPCLFCTRNMLITYTKYYTHFFIRCTKWHNSKCRSAFN